MFIWLSEHTCTQIAMYESYIINVCIRIVSTVNEICSIYKLFAGIDEIILVQCGLYKKSGYLWFWLFLVYISLLFQYSDTNKIDYSAIYNEYIYGELIVTLWTCFYSLLFYHN